ncbi:hypothetical protein [Acaryochloris marina]|uniref:Uncharacterized protein n=1 Tax=Acaryochloris marina (strain MBIC 11017) TaxID=329726 RepID=A8ZN09_ACAM1|nr:hypothetical protein [Acaryochloris marina]ABW32208.1 hypothetical protein AM1_C0278 [Acaryochloris marina MBIC11017]
MLTLTQFLEHLDLKIYVETPDDLRMNRGMAKDLKLWVCQLWRHGVIKSP